MTTCLQLSQAYYLEPAYDSPTVYVLPETYDDARFFLQSPADNKPEALGNTLSRDKEWPDANDSAVFLCASILKRDWLEDS